MGHLVHNTSAAMLCATHASQLGVERRVGAAAYAAVQDAMEAAVDGGSSPATEALAANLIRGWNPQTSGVGGGAEDAMADAVRRLVDSAYEVREEGAALAARRTHARALEESSSALTALAAMLKELQPAQHSYIGNQLMHAVHSEPGRDTVVPAVHPLLGGGLLDSTFDPAHAASLAQHGGAIAHLSEALLAAGEHMQGSERNSLGKNFWAKRKQAKKAAAAAAASANDALDGAAGAADAAGAAGTAGSPCTEGTAGTEGSAGSAGSAGGQRRGASGGASGGGSTYASSVEEAKHLMAGWHGGWASLPRQLINISRPGDAPVIVFQVVDYDAWSMGARAHLYTGVTYKWMDELLHTLSLIGTSARNKILDAIKSFHSDYRPKQMGSSQGGKELSLRRFFLDVSKGCKGEVGVRDEEMLVKSLFECLPLLETPKERRWFEKRLSRRIEDQVSNPSQIRMMVVDANEAGEAARGGNGRGRGPANRSAANMRWSSLFDDGVTFAMPREKNQYVGVCLTQSWLVPHLCQPCTVVHVSRPCALVYACVVVMELYV
jgi:hypothetical protein